MSKLFDPIRVGDLELPNRVIMAPLTRSRAIGGGRVPNALMAQYYVQRASAGLILSEATAVTPQGVGYADTPGIWSDEQVAGWKMVTDAVHAAGIGDRIHFEHGEAVVTAYDNVPCHPLLLHVVEVVLAR